MPMLECTGRPIFRYDLDRLQSSILRSLDPVALALDSNIEARRENNVAEELAAEVD